MVDREMTAATVWSRYRSRSRFYGLIPFCKFAQKRALIAAVLASCGASQFFMDLDTGGEE